MKPIYLALTCVEHSCLVLTCVKQSSGEPVLAASTSVEPTSNGAALTMLKSLLRLEASAKDKVTLKPPTREQRGPWRTIGGPLRIPLNVRYDKEEYTVMYVQRSWLVLALQLIVPVVLLIVCLIGALIAHVPFDLFAIALLGLLFWIGLIIINYIDDVVILTNKRIIDINQRYLFLQWAGAITSYDNIRDIKVEKSNPYVDSGTVIARTPDFYPDIVMPIINNPFDLQDRIFRIKNYMGKKEERKP